MYSSFKGVNVVIKRVCYLQVMFTTVICVENIRRIAAACFFSGFTQEDCTHIARTTVSYNRRNIRRVLHLTFFSHAVGELGENICGEAPGSKAASE